MHQLDERLHDQLGDEEATLLLATLTALAAGARDALGEGLVGVYLVGSFALGGGDLHADVDFLVVSDHALTDADRKAVHRLHAALLDRPEHWAQHLEGSWVSRTDLRRRASLDEPWWYVDNGSRELEWSIHDNTEVLRWVLRHRAPAVTGPPANTLLDDVPPDALRREVALDAELRRQDVAADPGYLRNAWGQPHEVLTRCRMLYTATTGRVTGKADAAAWCKDLVPARWHDLIDRAVTDRPDPWGRVHREADPDLAVRTAVFVDLMTDLVREAASP